MQESGRAGRDGVHSTTFLLYQGMQLMHGKSLTFELAPYTFARLFGEDCNAIVLVIVSLISLMKDQDSNLNSRGIRASSGGDDCSEEQLEDILNLKEKIVFGSPAAILNNYRHIFCHLKTKSPKVIVRDNFRTK